MASPEDFGNRVEVLSTLCSETSYDRLGQDLARHCKFSNQKPFAVDFTNVHIVAMRDSDPEFRETTNAMDIFVPDSTVLTWASNLRGAEMKDRVYGPGFLSHIIDESPAHIRHFFLGASEDCLQSLLKNVKRRNPNFQIVGSRNGYFGPDEEESVLAEVNAAEADFVWIGLGTPKQQEWISRFKERVRAGSLLAVGFAFDVNAGTKKDAPISMQKMGLTWLYRLSQEPSRLWERYLVYNSMFVSRLAKQVIQDGRNGRVVLVPEELSSQPKLSAAAETSVLDLEVPPSEKSKDESQLPKRTNVLGVGISVITLEDAADLVLDASDGNGAHYVTVTGVHGVMESQRSQEIKDIHNASFLSTPDGMPMVWIGQWNGDTKISRVYGPDLMLKTAEKTMQGDRKHFFYGGKEGVAKKLGKHLSEWFPGLQVAGSFCPPFRELNQKEEDSLVQQLKELQPHFMWVGLSTPKQERFMSGLLQRHPDLTQGWSHGLVLLGVGAAFDFHTGRLAQAPRWMQERGLEWFFRLLKEPRRLFKRYSINNSTFIWNVFLQMSGLKDYELKR